MTQTSSHARSRKWTYRLLLLLMVIGGAAQAYHLDRSWERQRVSEDRLAAAVDGSAQGLWSWPIPENHENWMQVSWWTGPNFHQVLKRGELPPLQRPQDYIERIHPDDRPVLIEEFREALAEERSFTIDHQVKSGSGNYLWVRLRGSVRSIDQQPVLSGSIVDITREKRERLRALMIVKSAPAAIVMCDRERRITVFNDIAEELFEVPAEEMLGKSTDILIPEEFRQRHKSLLQASAKQLQEHEGDTYFLRDAITATARRPDGSTFSARLSIRGFKYRDEVEFAVVIRPGVPVPPVPDPAMALPPEMKPLKLQDEANSRAFRPPRRRQSS